MRSEEGTRDEAEDGRLQRGVMWNTAEDGRLQWWHDGVRGPPRYLNGGRGYTRAAELGVLVAGLPS